jgi:preprotein translocase subunit SecG
LRERVGVRGIREVFQMTTFLLIVHLTVCFILVIMVLLQTGKGAEIGASFGGGSSQTLFGSRGAGTFMSKVTAAAAAIFMLTSLLLALKWSNVSGSSIVTGAPAAKEAPAAPASAQPVFPAPGTPSPAPAKPAFPAPQGGK